jgi:transposase-like protein
MPQGVAQLKKKPPPAPTERQRAIFDRYLAGASMAELGREEGVSARAIETWIRLVDEANRRERVRK